MFLFYSVGQVCFAFAVVLELKGREGVGQGGNVSRETHRVQLCPHVSGVAKLHFRGNLDIPHRGVLPGHLAVDSQHRDHAKHPVHFPPTCHWHGTRIQYVLASPEAAGMEGSAAGKAVRKERCFVPSPMTRRSHRTAGFAASFTAARSCGGPGRAAAGTARGYPVSCASTLTPPQGKLPAQGLQEKLSLPIRTTGHTKHLRVTENKGENRDGRNFLFPDVKRI